jgi:uncharacterized membrane protein YjjB (DUF3815 family)
MEFPTAIQPLFALAAFRREFYVADLESLLMAVVLTADLFARLARRGVAIPLAPAVMLLVPGSSIGVVSLTERNVLSGVETAYQTALVAIAPTTGLLVGNLLFPSRDTGTGRVAPAP